ncbi:MAG: hypothetical protein EHM35_03485 [Planctomycetaceae bacterium]|nr:MAG: hypothetical protein EHM35_03485 [Planctomycetaceae bacterium]
MKRFALALTALLLTVPAFATVPTDSATTAGPYACDGADTTFTFSFGIDSTADLQVVKITVATGGESTLTLTTDYAVTSANTNDPQDFTSGGTVTTTTAYSSAYQILLRRLTTKTQTVNIDDEEVEEALDKLTRGWQEVVRDLGLCLKIQPSDAGDTVQFAPAGTAGYAYRAANGEWSLAVSLGPADADPNLMLIADADPNAGDVFYWPTTTTGSTFNTTPFGRTFAGVADANHARPNLELGIINVKDHPYHAKGDWNGTTGTDDTAAVDAAIVAAAGRKVLFPPGTYLYTGTLAITTPDVYLCGANTIAEQHAYQADANVATLRITGATTGILAGVAPTVNGTYLGQLRIENLRIVVDNDTDIAVHLWHGKNCSFENVTIYGNNDTDASQNVGLKVSAGIHNTFRNVTVLGSLAPDGDTIAGSTTNYLYYNLYLTVGFLNEPMTTTTFYDCYLGYCQRGVYCYYSFANFYNTTVESCYDLGLEIIGNSLGPNFYSCWFENDPNRIAAVDGIDPGPNMHFSDCLFNIGAGGSSADDDNFFYLRYGRLRFDNCIFSADDEDEYHLIQDGAAGGTAQFSHCVWPGGIDPTINRVMKIAGGAEGPSYAYNQVKIWDFNGDLIFGGLSLGADGATQGTVTLWDGSGGNTPGYIKIHSPNGTAWYLFVEDDGTLKVHSAPPTANGDGSAVGGQS